MMIYLVLTFFVFTGCEKTSDDLNEKFVKIVGIQSCPVVPFAKMELEISNYELIKRNSLPPRENMTEGQLESYDSWNQEPTYFELDSIKYDSISNFIINSGILNLDLKYTNPDTTGGLIIMSSGACSYSYYIETSKRIYEFPIYGASDFELPDNLKEFDDLFKRITLNAIE